MKKRSVGFLLTISLGLVLFLITAYAGIFQTNTQSNFDEGSYNNTIYNSSGKYVQLNLSIQNISNGEYISRIFDAGTYAIWKNISWVEANVDNNLTNLSTQVRVNDNNASLGDFKGPDNATSTYYTNNSLELLNIQGRYLQYRFLFETNNSNLSPSLYNVTLGYDNLSSSVNVSLVSPANNTKYTTTNNVTLSYLVASVLNIASCSLILNNDVDSTDTTVTIGETQSFDKIGLGNSNHTWSIKCTDVNNFVNSSETRVFEVAYVPEEDEEDDGGGGGGDTGEGGAGPSTPSRPPRNTQNNNENTTNTTSNSTQQNVTNPVFETVKTGGGFFTGLFAGINTFGSAFGTFALNNLVYVILLGMIISFVAIRFIHFRLHYGGKFKDKKRKK